MMNKTQETFSQKEVLSLLGIRQYVLRYWESEFVQISQLRDMNGQRIYSQRDIVIIKKIKSLLLDQKYSLAKAKHLVDSAFASEISTEGDQISFQQVRSDLINLRNKISEHITRVSSLTN